MSITPDSTTVMDSRPELKYGCCVNIPVQYKLRCTVADADLFDRGKAEIEWGRMYGDAPGRKRREQVATGCERRPAQPLKSTQQGSCANSGLHGPIIGSPVRFSRLSRSQR